MLHARALETHVTVSKYRIPPTPSRRYAPPKTVTLSPTIPTLVTFEEFPIFELLTLLEVDVLWENSVM